MVTGINTGLYNYNYGYNNGITNGYNTGIYQPPVFNPQTPQTVVKPPKDNVADGKDDGNIGFWKATGNFLKGALKFVTSPFTDDQGNFSLSKTLKTVAIGAAIALIPGAAPIALAAGLTFGAVGMARAGVNIMTATTDAEAEAAWQSMGSSTTAVGLSLYGAKQYAKSTGVENAGVRDGVKAVFKDSKDAVVNGYKAVRDASPQSIAESVGKKWDSAKQYYTDTKKAFSEARAEWKNMTPEERTAYREALQQQGKDAISGFFTKEDGTPMTFGDMGKRIFGIAQEKGKAGVDAIKGLSAEKQAIIAGTYGIAGRTNVKPDFYSQLSKTEQQYYDALPVTQQQALINQYYAAI